MIESREKDLNKLWKKTAWGETVKLNFNGNCIDFDNIETNKNLGHICTTPLSNNCYNVSVYLGEKLVGVFTITCTDTKTKSFVFMENYKGLLLKLWNFSSPLNTFFRVLCGQSTYEECY